jgi:hypothetical protein
LLCHPHETPAAPRPAAAQSGTTEVSGTTAATESSKQPNTKLPRVLSHEIQAAVCPSSKRYNSSIRETANEGKYQGRLVLLTSRRSQHLIRQASGTTAAADSSQQ